jgi:hypothetical protein
MFFIGDKNHSSNSISIFNFQQDKSYTYLHQFAVFFDKNLVKYTFGILYNPRF